MSEIVWADPPEPKVPNSNAKADKLKVFAATLRENPGRWAAYPFTPKQASHIALYIKRGTWSAGPGFDATSRTTDEGPRVYVRFIGDAS